MFWSASVVKERPHGSLPHPGATAQVVEAGVDHVSAYALIVEDGTPLARRTIGGRTTYSCPVHQP